jgi:hypothetical protein
MQQNKDRMQDLEEENAALRQRNAELVEALKGAQSALYWLFSLKQIKDKDRSPAEFFIKLLNE